MDYSSTLAAVRSLSADEQMRIVETIWDDLVAQSAAPDLTDAQKREIDRRVASYQADPSQVIPWEQVKAEAKARSRQFLSL